MKNWKDITLYQFQQIEKINRRTDIEDLDKTLFCVCVLFGMTEHELNNAGKAKAEKLLAKVNSIFSQSVVPKVKSRLGIYKVNYDMPKITFGQFIELAFFLHHPIDNGHFIMATMSRKLFSKHDSENHKNRADYFLKMPIEYVLGSVKRISEAFNGYNSNYRFLFGLDEEQHSEEVKTHPFMKRFGWEYSAEQVMNHLGITMKETLALPVGEALYALTYLKSKAKFEYDQSQK